MSQVEFDKHTELVWDTDLCDKTFQYLGHYVLEWPRLPVLEKKEKVGKVGAAPSTFSDWIRQLSLFRISSIPESQRRFWRSVSFQCWGAPNISTLLLLMKIDFSNNHIYIGWAKVYSSLYTLILNIDIWRKICFPTRLKDIGEQRKLYRSSIFCQLPTLLFNIFQSSVNIFDSKISTYFGLIFSTYLSI